MQIKLIGSEEYVVQALWRYADLYFRVNFRLPTEKRRIPSFFPFQTDFLINENINAMAIKIMGRGNPATKAEA